jgi:type IV pilus assembly protein PilB
MGNRIGELLVREKLISLQQLRTAQEESRKGNTSLGYQLARLGFISDSEITDFLSQQYRVQSINLDEYDIEEDVRKLISQEVCERHKVIPVSRTGSSILVAMADPSNLHAIDDIKFLTGYNVEPVVASEAQILRVLEKAASQQPEVSYDQIMEGFEEGDIDFAGEDDDVNVGDLEKASEDAPVIRLCNAILLNAIKKRASDIHIEPYEKKLRVRYRIDGVLVEEMNPPLKLKAAISSRLKIMSSLDIAERRLPQDGRIKLKLGKGKEMDYRVSTLPTLWGEKIVMRLLDKSNLQLDMTKLGFDQKPLDDFKWAINQPYGMVLVTGPTGSGKTTTLYSALSELNQPDTNVSTAEDPVEYNLMGINQCQMHDDIGLNFAAALRSFLRQDPDIIMVGEIRDFETAEIAVKAALTGHLVLSTLHTNDAPSTITRLMDMGVDPFMVSSSLLCIGAQRLARKICEGCRRPLELPEKELLSVGFLPEEIPGIKLFQANPDGCPRCSGGYKGRFAILESLYLDEQLKRMIVERRSVHDLKHEAVKQGMLTLRRVGLLNAMRGRTSLEEVLRTTLED